MKQLMISNTQAAQQARVICCTVLGDRAIKLDREILVHLAAEISALIYNHTTCTIGEVLDLALLKVGEKNFQQHLADLLEDRGIKAENLLNPLNTGSA